MTVQLQDESNSSYATSALQPNIYHNMHDMLRTFFSLKFLCSGSKLKEQRSGLDLAAASYSNIQELKRKRVRVVSTSVHGPGFEVSLLILLTSMIHVCIKLFTH